MRFVRSVHNVAAAVAVLSLAAGLTSCSSTPDPTPAATALAQAVASGAFAGVPLAGAAPADVTAQVEELTAGMGEATRTVEVRGIDETEDGQRQVTLEVNWDLDGGGGDWAYSTTALLSLTDEAWQAQWSPAALHPGLAGGGQLVLRRQQAERADVLGAGGAAIVTQRPVYRIGIDKAQAGAQPLRDAATALADLVGVDPSAYADRVEASGPQAFVEAITLREEDAATALARVEGITGARAIPGTLALAPTREFARPILGTVGDATAEVVEASAGAVVAGDVVGLSGLQQQYDEQLRGVPGLTVELVPPGGDAGDGTGGDAEAEPEVVFERLPQPGQPVTTTLDAGLQTRAEGVLAGVGPPSALVAIQPSTGNVLAAASGPGGEGYSTATLAQHAPGSTFKIVTSLALLRAGVAPDAVLQCPATTVVDGRTFKNYSDYPSGALGDITFREAVANSCNTAMIGQHEVVGQANLAAAAASLGLGVEYDPGVPAFVGSVPAEAGGTEHAASMIGQGKVLASPLAMATVAASIAAGRTVTPRIVESAGGGGDTEAATAGGAAPLTGAEAGALQALLRGVVEGGSAAFLRDVPGEPVGAKTGTAEYGTDVPPRTHAWMIATQGDLAVAAFVEDGPSGSRTAGPLLAAFLTAG